MAHRAPRLLRRAVIAICLLLLVAGPVAMTAGVLPGVTAMARARVSDLRAALAYRKFLYGLDGVETRRGLMLPMADGTRLATDLYLPRDRAGPVPAILLRLPYGKQRFGAVRHWARVFLPRGYAVVVQDMRGRYDSEGTFAPYATAGADGAATLDWIAAQDWSDGQVGTLGCSALGESQFMLAARRHPAHRAMIPMGAGGAIGTLGGSWGMFGAFEGGVFALATGFGWFASSGGKTGDRMAAPQVDYARALRTLPLRDAMTGVRPDPTDFADFMDRFEDPAYWRDMGYVSDADRFETPFLVVDSWYDGARESLALAAHMRRTGAPGSVVILPGLHCDLTGAFDSGAVGDMPVDGTAPDFETLFAGVMDHAMKGGPAPDLPPVMYYMLGEDRWMSAADWPPPDTVPRSFFLDGDRLTDAPQAPGQIAFASDPADPVPSLGGAICCTGDPDQREGPVYQNAIEDRPDVAVLTSAPLAAPLRIAGPVEARLTVTADVPDTDLVLRLTDVDDRGRSLTIQEGALRLRYRDGVDAPRLMTPGEAVQVTVQLRDIAYRVPAGHRLRLHIAGSSFPRLARNMNGGGDPYAETEPRVAHVEIATGGDRASRLNLHVLPDN